ncbi:MAG: manganese efflux pump MntP family protein [Candidatus Korobacteraceae bacterium]|jgi:putative Mn2+ efflux pump MntP
MSWFSLLGIAVALAVDAFAVALVAGLSVQAVTKRRLFRLSFHFGLFQAMMLAAGWLFGKALYLLTSAFANWIAFVLLVLVGGNIIRQALHASDEPRIRLDPTRGWQLVFLSFATSIDALAVGLSLAMMGVSIAVAAAMVGLAATSLTVLGMHLGNRASLLWGKRVEVLGGLILIAIGLASLWNGGMPKG